jgi:phenol 2-monooxygenase
MSVTYAPSVFTGNAGWQHLAEGFEIGTRFHSAPVVRLADAKPMELGHTIAADTRWRLFAFGPARDPWAGTSEITALCEFLANAPASPVRRYTPAGRDPDSLMDLRAVFQNHVHDLDLASLPPLLLPRIGSLGLIDYEKVFCASPSPGADIFDLRGIDRAQGCMVIVRPDQYVAHVLPLDAFDELSRFFDGFMQAPGGRDQGLFNVPIDVTA